MIEFLFFLMSPLGAWIRHERSLGYAVYLEPADLPVLVHPHPGPR